MQRDAPDVQGLGYVGIAAPDVGQWRDFALDVCGWMAAPHPPAARPAGVVTPAADANGASADGTVYLKLDDRQWRVAVHPADAPELRYLGFELPSVAALSPAVDHISKHGVRVREGTQTERDARGVAALEDLAGHRIELFAAPFRDRGFVSPHGMEFLTGNLGMGHAVLYVPDIDAALAFYRDVVGLRRTDYMTFGPNGMGIHFLRCGRRHHCLALLHVGPHSGLQHLMFETTTLDDVGRALDRAQASGVSITSSLGRHRNDETVSFYMRGPVGVRHRDRLGRHSRRRQLGRTRVRRRRRPLGPPRARRRIARARRLTQRLARRARAGTRSGLA
jgi:3,4-dihydroxy-9,10-secoandrosta-1,3,5(10)-triene-9,17-dione 4,5-dioxygenase